MSESTKRTDRPPYDIKAILMIGAFISFYKHINRKKSNFLKLKPGTMDLRMALGFVHFSGLESLIYKFRLIILFLKKNNCIVFT
jgi:hypothetical protein